MHIHLKKAKSKLRNQLYKTQEKIVSTKYNKDGELILYVRNSYSLAEHLPVGK